ncbi:hypothetical protein K469DRAFT_670101 [Zopfia rhizophila CBS 207.26]|uniref:Uncharacterized protein n=1 Tax=Zopfia rhizophila CBS 207.26 TaxID=1314779 RepID=A0A6A6DW63_9PEZI|nr:hypothetical protein K469DRAFT_670101 [Zopfia rhizophila CBS 207.26]
MSAALRIPCLSQSRLMVHIGGPQHIREDLVDALATEPNPMAYTSDERTPPNSHTSSEGSNVIDISKSLEGKPRWIHCTPLLGSDSEVGV